MSTTPFKQRKLEWATVKKILPKRKPPEGPILRRRWCDRLASGLVAHHFFFLRLFRLHNRVPGAPAVGVLG